MMSPGETMTNNRQRLLRWVRWGGSVVVTAALTGGGLVALAPVASATEVLGRPANGVLSVNGHGYGHGRGMSQWGAYGAATKGLRYQQILAFYYPGTTLGSLPSSTITVRVTSDTDSTTEVLAQGGLTATVGSRTVLLPSGATRWRVISAPGYQLQFLAAGAAANAWQVYDLMGNGSGVPGPVTLSRAAGTVRLVLGGTHREYVGSIVGARYAGVHYSVVRTTMETYLRGVVPNEMPASWSAEALKAQAVAARSYAANMRGSAPVGRPYQTCDSTACQVFYGVADYNAAGARTATRTDARTDAAIKGSVTANGSPAVVSYGGKPAFTEFSASNGGYSTTGDFPYLTAKADPYDGAVPNKAHSWTDAVAVATIEAKFPAVGRLVSIEVLRDGKGAWGGRPDTVTLVGSKGRQTVAGSTFSSAAGFLHRWWAPRFAAPMRDLTSDGHNDLVARASATGRLYVYRGDGSRFTTAIEWGSGWSGMSSLTATGDFSGDGRTDIVAVQQATGRMYLYAGRGNGSVLPGTVIGTGWGSMRQVTSVGDFSGDGLPDLLGVAADGRLILYRGDGKGRLKPGTTAGSRGWTVFDKLIGVGDLDGDGNADLIGRVRSAGRLVTYRGNGKGGFLAGSTQTGTGWNAMSMLAAAGDLSGDGRPDLVAVERATGLMWRYETTPTGPGARVQIGHGWSGIDLLG